MPRVFIVNNMTHTYDSAEKFGKLVNVTEGRIPIFKTDVMASMLSKGLAGFTQDDYLLISGPALICIIASQIVFSKFNQVKFLVFDAKEQDYVVRHLHKNRMNWQGAISE